MRLHRFFVNKPLEHTREAIKDDRLIHQWRDVFRYNIGSEVVLFDGSNNEYDCVIEKLNNREAEVRLVSERKGIVIDKEIILCQSLIKKDKMEWVVEKATELGVSKIVPIVSERSEKKGFNLERARKIAIEASEQCGRADVPAVAEVINLDEALKNCGDAIVCDSSGESLECEAISELQTHKLSSLSLFIGPEGGWTEKEIEKFKFFDKAQDGNSKLKIFSLGKLTLRAETAAIAALTILRLPD
jgi:16S rRNA (uracil1498-N3)-methyltransferase